LSCQFKKWQHQKEAHNIINNNQLALNVGFPFIIDPFTNLLNLSVLTTIIESMSSVNKETNKESKQVSGDENQKVFEELTEIVFPGYKGWATKDFKEDGKRAISEYIKKVDPKSFYQWFCPYWQSMEYVYSTGGNMVTDEDWSFLVGKVLDGLILSTEADPKLCAMCCAFVHSSLYSHVIAQTTALRMLIHLAIIRNLSTNPDFFSWLLHLMQDRIDEAIEVKDKRPLFIDVVFQFFASLKSYNELAIITLCRVFSTKKIISYVFPKANELKAAKKEIQRSYSSFDLAKSIEDCKSNAAKIAKTVFKSAFQINSIFIFENICDSVILMPNYSPAEKQLLDIFVNGNMNDFLTFISKNKDLVREYDLNISHLREMMEVLVFVSLCSGQKVVSIKEISDACKIKEEDVKTLIPKINQSEVAVVKLNSLTGKADIIHCQPRTFNEKVWESTTERIDNLIKVIETNARNVK